MQTPDAREKIEHHRKTFITEEDFKWLSQHNINAVRIPVGYWLFEADGPYTPTGKFLDWALEMAEKYEMKVLIDLHAAPGSQNGHDHSGQVGSAEWYTDRANQQRTIEILEKIVKRYGENPVVWGIELLNEPKPGIWQWKLRRFYKQAFQRITAIARPDLSIVFHDAFRPLFFSGAIRSRHGHPVAMDVHWYHFGNWRRVMPVDIYFRWLEMQARLFRWLGRTQPVIVGEWSLVIAHSVLKRYEKDQRMAYLRRHGELQLQVFASAAGWFYWTYKTEENNYWNFRFLIESGAINTAAFPPESH